MTSMTTENERVLFRSEKLWKKFAPNTPLNPRNFSNVGVAHAKRDGLAWLEGTKQYETELSCVYQHCYRGEIVPIKIAGEHNPADLLTKIHIGTVDKCETARKRICGHSSSEPFKQWMKSHLDENFDGSAMVDGGFVSLKDLTTKFGLEAPIVMVPFTGSMFFVGTALFSTTLYLLISLCLQSSEPDQRPSSNSLVVPRGRDGK